MSNWVSAQVPASHEGDVLAFLCDFLLVPLNFPTIVKQSCQYVLEREQAVGKKKDDSFLNCFD